MGQTYLFSIVAVNHIGESLPVSLTIIAASVPQQLQTPVLILSTPSSITIQASPPSFTGGAQITSYAFTRDQGPTTSFMAQFTSATNSYLFTGLTAGTQYRFKVAAINSIGQGAWSSVVSFYACTNPDDPSSFVMTSQGQDHLSVAWSSPTNQGGCSVSGYLLSLENINDPGMRIVYNGI